MSENEPEPIVEILTLTAAEYDWLVARLEEPPKELPHLRKLLRGDRDE